MQRRSSIFLILLCGENFEDGIVLNLILIFELFEAHCSYKIVLIKKECITISQLFSLDITSSHFWADIMYQQKVRYHLDF